MSNGLYKTADIRDELAEAVIHPWNPPSEAMQQIADVDFAAAEFETLRAVERQGLWGDGDGCATQDMAFLRTLLPPGASLALGAQGYAAIFGLEKTQHSDPTPQARKTLQVVAPTLRPGESLPEAAQAYVELFRYVVGQDIDASEHAREAYRTVDAGLVANQDHLAAAREYVKNPNTFAARQAAIQKAFDARQAEVRRVAEAVSQKAPAGRVEIQDEWILLNGVRVPRRGAQDPGCSPTPRGWLDRAVS